MADPAPLLDKSGQSDEATSNSGMHKNISLDSAFDQCLGDQFGLIQLLQVFLISLSWAFDAQQVFISIFTDAVPTWHCTVNSVTSCSPAAKLCEMKEGTWAWDLPAHASIVSEWNLQCSSPTILGLPASSHFIGCLVGGLALSTLADSSLGRKKTLVLSCLVMSLGGALTTLSTDIWVYSALRFISGFGRATVGTSALVLITELIGNRWRGHVAMVSYSFFTVGFLSLPAFAYMCRGHSWRIIYLLTSLPTVLYTLLAHYFVLESPRWLLRVYQHGQKTQLYFLATLSWRPKHISISCQLADVMCDTTRSLMLKVHVSGSGNTRKVHSHLHSHTPYVLNIHGSPFGNNLAPKTMN